jgi:putative addiction module component (TIGR02574 family)
MNERVKHIAEQARKLTPEEQADLLGVLTDMVEGEAYEIDPELLEECERRWEAYERGEVKAYTWEEVKAQLRKL